MDLCNRTDIELICVIVNFGTGSKIIQSAKQYGIPGGTVLLGKGTVNNRILDFLGLSDIRKEIILMVADAETAARALKKLNEVYAFEKPNHGIAFTSPICATCGTRNVQCGDIKDKRSVTQTMYQSITIIVDKGKAEDVINASVKAGSKGGTILNARGSGVHEVSKVFSMDIEPEKEIVLILSEEGTTEAIVSSIKEQLKIDEPGNGILFVQSVNETYGIYK